MLWAPLREGSALALCHPGALRRREVECTVRKKKREAGTRRSDRQDNGTGPKDTVKSKSKNTRGALADRSKPPMAHDRTSKAGTVSQPSRGRGIAWPTWPTYSPNPWGAGPPPQPRAFCRVYLRRQVAQPRGGISLHHLIRDPRLFRPRSIS